MTRPPEPPELRLRLQELRSALLALHKTLVESERVEYEKVIGKVRSPNHLLQLLMSDPWFAWLSPLSQLVVAIDEALDAEEPLTAGVVDALVSRSAQLLVASETAEGFAKHYYVALQRDPDVVLAQGKVAGLHPGRRPRH